MQGLLGWHGHAQPIAPLLSIHYGPVVYGGRELPKAFCNIRVQAESWAADQLMRLRRLEVGLG
ncbi:hypothetical protein VB716_08520 [Synechococcus sp. CCY9201]|uniref:hypothetical protein n=1 Tax=Synechococcus sp. CCY9201 TaxID=174697 RepID=UPI002B203CCB|nr:hypothetical protein [Synechococcus sp. CCY9201]MEA5474264.1 hypothetical protein [Synechococcus sp. CCY9201]